MDGWAQSLKTDRQALRTNSLQSNKHSQHVGARYLQMQLCIECIGNEAAAASREGTWQQSKCTPY